MKLRDPIPYFLFQGAGFLVSPPERQVQSEIAGFNPVIGFYREGFIWLFRCGGLSSWTAVSVARDATPKAEPASAALSDHQQNLRSLSTEDRVGRVEPARLR